MSSRQPAPGSLTLPLSLRLLRGVPLPRKLGLLERLYGKRLARHGVTWATTAAGPAWKLDLSDVGHRWMLYGGYEGPLQMRWIRRWLRSGDVVIDSGANIGQMLLNFACAAEVRIIAFEPLPSARAWLLECLERQTGWNVTVLACGLGAVSERVALRLHGAMSTTRLDWYPTQALDTLEIQVEALDSMMAALGVDRIRLWKLDIEGGEPAAIHGARHYLESRRIEAVLVESAPELFAELHHAFAAVGYSLFEIRSRGRLRTATGLRFGNLLALPAEP